MLRKLSVPVSVLFTVILVMPGCTNYEPVNASQCGEIVQHNTKILGKFAKPKAEMMKACKDSTDIQRGCAMQAKIVADLSKCANL